MQKPIHAYTACGKAVAHVVGVNSRGSVTDSTLEGNVFVASLQPHDVLYTQVISHFRTWMRLDIQTVL